MNKQIVLTDRERTVLEALWNGQTLKDIATALDLSYGRTRAIRLAIGHKLQAGNSWQLARRALELGMIEVKKG